MIYTNKTSDCKIARMQFSLDWCVCEYVCTCTYTHVRILLQSVIASSVNQLQTFVYLT